MKFFVYLISFIAIMALMGLFIFKQPNGQPWLSVDKLLPNTPAIEKNISAITSKIKTISLSTDIEDSSHVNVYRWQDVNGNWSYSDKPNAAFDSEKLSLNPDEILVLPSFEPPKNDVAKPISDEKRSLSPKTSPPSKVMELYKNANNVQKIMDGREQQISKAINESSR